MCKWSPNFTCKKEEKKANEQSGPEKKIPLLLPLRSYSAISPKKWQFFQNFKSSVHTSHIDNY